MNIKDLFHFGSAGQNQGMLPAKAEKEASLPPVPKEGFTKAGQLDNELSSGVIPKDLRQRYEAENEPAERDYKFSLKTSLFGRGVMGGMMGYLLGMAFSGATAAVISPLAAAGIAIGTGLGLYRGWKYIQDRFAGKVNINIDGEESVRKFRGNAHNYEKSPREIKAQLTAEGLIGDRISPYTVSEGKSVGKADPEKLKELREHAQELVQLAKLRRLAADFGKKSSYGYEALNLIDANMAKDLIAAGKPVYIISGKKSEDVPHHYTTSATTKDRKSLVEKAYDYLERRFEYTTTQINDPEDLKNVAKGSGLPEGISGVYKKGISYTEIIYDNKQVGSALIREEGGTSYNRVDYSRSRKSQVRKPDITPTGSVEPVIVHKFDFSRLGAMMGVMVGILVTLPFSVPGSAVVWAGVLGGGTLGYNIGKRLTDKMPGI